MAQNLTSEEKNSSIKNKNYLKTLNPKSECYASEKGKTYS